MKELFKDMEKLDYFHLKAYFTLASSKNWRV